MVTAIPLRNGTGLSATAERQTGRYGIAIKIELLRETCAASVQ